MFRMSIKDMGSACVTKDVMIHRDRRDDAESVAEKICSDITGRDGLTFFDPGDMEYIVYDGLILIGSYWLTRFNR